MNQPTAITRRDLAERGMDALDQGKQSGIAVSRIAGGVSFATALEVMEFAKLMSTADKAVPKHLRANPGACLRIVFQAVEWQMSPWAVADKSYEVNDRIAYESQLIHAVVEARAPLKERLSVRYEGEGQDRRCTIIGKFIDGTERTVETPRIRDIKVKNSPLWTSDPDQQLFYYGSRAWGRRWTPDVIMGLYTPDELRDSPQLGRPEEETEPGLHARLVGGNVSREEGHQGAEHVEREINGADTTTETQEETQGTEAEPSPKKKRSRKAAAEPQTEATTTEEPGAVEAALPKNAQEWEKYCRSWIMRGVDYQAMRARWDSERKMRNDCGVISEQREPIMELLNIRCKEMGEGKNATATE